jgi:VanZ family protein
MLAPSVQHSYTLGMRKYLDIPLTVIVTTVIIAAMFWPLEAVPPAPERADKLVHFMAFVALAFPLARTGRLGLLPVFIGMSAFGAIIELIQPTFNRSADLNDWVADTLGVLIGIGLGLAYRRVRRHKS